MPADRSPEPGPSVAPGPIAEPESPPRRSLLRDVVEVVVLAALIYLLIAVAVRPVHVEGTSMYPTLDNNNLLVAQSVSLYVEGPSRGNIVVIKPPIPSSDDFIKRVIGLPGEWIRIAPDKHGVGHVYISETKPTSATGGRQLHEPYINGVWQDEVVCCTAAGTSSPLLPTTGRWQRIPADDYFVMGDNRNVSEDSRTFGWEPRKGIAAIAIARFWPLNKLGPLPGGTPTFTLILGVGLLLPLQPQRATKGRSSRRRHAPS